MARVLSQYPPWYLFTNRALSVRHLQSAQVNLYRVFEILGGASCLSGEPPSTERDTISPHDVLTEPRDGKSVSDLAEFTVTRNAFLPEDGPCRRLADTYYEPWESIATQLPILIQNGTLSLSIASLPVLSTARLRSESEWRRAYSMLAFMAHTHVWDGEVPDEASCATFSTRA